MIRKFLFSLLEPRIRAASREEAQATSSRPGRDRIMDYAFEFAAKSGLDGSYLEFGCYQGRSFIQAWRAYMNVLGAGWPGQRMTRRKMYAFDSFQGLPELKGVDVLEGYSVFEEGQYSCTEAEFLRRLGEAGVDPDLVATVAGFYEDTLTADLISRLNPDKAMIVHVDCDLHASAARALDFVTPLVQDGTMILFDDYYCYRGHPQLGVRGAFDEWLCRTGVLASGYLNYDWAGKAFILNLPVADKSAPADGIGL